MDNSEIMIPMSEVIELISMDISIEVQHREYVNMTPLQCYEAGVVDTGTAIRKALRDAIQNKWNPPEVVE
jgi:hypothetical protein